MKRCVRLGERDVEYELTVKKVKNINLRIKADGSVWVSANKKVPIPIIEKFLISKEDFILSALDRFEGHKEDQTPEAEYADKECVRILGKSFTLQLENGRSNKVLPFFNEGYIRLCVKETADKELRKKTFEKWQKELCRELITSLCTQFYEKYPAFAERGIPYPTLHFKTMKTRWGSCNSSGGSLNFNYSLIQKPLECVEYVVAHEFVHFLHPNHSKSFYSTLSELMPDWKKRKDTLNNRDT